MENEKLIVGLTGGIGSGKSEVSRRFQALGAIVVDADEAAREVVQPDQPALKAIAQHFGSQFIANDGLLDRAKLRAVVFADMNEKRWLENLLHPLVNTLIRQQLAAASGNYVLLSSPLLLETNQHKLVDRVLVVDASEELQLLRAGNRDNNTTEQIKAIMATQLTRLRRLERADDVVHNHGNLLELDLQIQDLHQHYLDLAKKLKRI